MATRRRRSQVVDDLDDVDEPRRRKTRRVELKPEALLEIARLRRVPTAGYGGKLQFEMDEIEALASIGLSQGEIAQALAVNRSTVESRLATDAEFREAYERGKARLRAAIATGLTYKAINERNLVAQIFLSKVHMGWRDSDSPWGQKEVDPSQLALQIAAQLNVLEKDEGAPA